jgi:hypothetical protein
MTPLFNIDWPMVVAARACTVYRALSSIWRAHPAIKVLTLAGKVLMAAEKVLSVTARV